MTNSKQALAKEMANLAKRQGRSLGLELGEHLKDFARIDHDLMGDDAGRHVDIAAAYGRGVLEGLSLQLNGASLSEQEVSLVLKHMHAMALQAVTTPGAAQ